MHRQGLNHKTQGQALNQKTQGQGPDDAIGLMQAVRISGVTTAVLRTAALAGRLRTIKQGRDVMTTRRHLHRYLLASHAAEEGTHPPFPSHYVAPE